MTVMAQQLKRMKDQLLDLSFRSPFLNFKQRDNSTVRIVQESPAELLRQLYEEQMTMELALWNETLGKVPGVTFFDELDSQPLEERHTDDIIQTAITLPDKLDSTLKSISQDAQDVLEEKGINLLHLALGMLQYPVKLSGGEIKVYLAPLLLLPAQIEKKNTL